MIEGVTRAFTHQLVRHRVGVSFAQQAQRVVNVSDSFDYLATGSVEDSLVYHTTMGEIQRGYAKLIEAGAHPQDARGVLPTNIKTNILMKINLRSLSGLLGIRLCVKAQGEFQEEVLKIHPWAERVLQVHCVQTGSCAFPGYKECPVKEAGLIPDVDTDSIKKVWENDRAEYQPKGG
jgi:flavin-dependent thymidylate synthase